MNQSEPESLKDKHYHQEGKNKMNVTEAKKIMRLYIEGQLEMYKDILGEEEDFDDAYYYDHESKYSYDARPPAFECPDASILLFEESVGFLYVRLGIHYRLKHTPPLNRKI